MVTAGAMASDFGTFKKTTYPLLTRIGPSLNSLSEFIISTLQWFGSVSGEFSLRHYRKAWFCADPLLPQLFQSLS